MNPFRDQEKFMRACDQTVDGPPGAQFDMYCNLIEEEHKEAEALALQAKEKTEK